MDHISFFSDSLSINFGSGGMVRSSGDLPYLEEAAVASGDSSLVDGELPGIYNESINGSMLNGSAVAPEFVFLESNWTILVAIAIGLLILITLAGNALVILSILLVKRLRTPYNFLIVSLATTDLGIAGLIMPMAALPELYGAWPLSNLICDIFICLDMLFCTASILNLAAISLDRFLVITKPFEYGQRRTPRFMLLLVGASWALSAGVSLPAVFGWRMERNVGECSYPPDLGFQLYATLVAFFVPTGVIIYVTFRIFFIVSKMAKADREANRSKAAEQAAFVQSSNSTANDSANRNNKKGGGSKAEMMMGLQEENGKPGSAGHRPPVSNFRTRISKVLRPFGSSSSGSGNENRELKAVNTLGVFLGTFLLCWLPFFTMQLVNALRRCGLPHECVPGTLFAVLLWLGYAKSLCNPIVNALYNRDIRRPFFEILRCRCRTLNSTLRNEAYADMYGRGGGNKPGGGPGGPDMKRTRSDAASTSATAGERYELAERGHR